MLSSKDEEQEFVLRRGGKVVRTTCRQLSDDWLGFTVRVCHHQPIILNHNLTVSHVVFSTNHRFLSTSDPRRTAANKAEFAAR